MRPRTGRTLSLAFLAAALAAALPAALPAHADGAGAGDGAKRDDAAVAAVEVGTDAPDFTLKDSAGADVALSSFRGKKTVVVAFYPKAFSRLCTIEMKCFATEWRKLDDRGVQVLAVSGDPAADLKTFSASVGARFPLLSDAGFAVAKRWGVWRPSPEGGFAARSVFVVDREGKVRFVDRDFVAPRTLEGTELLRTVDALRPPKSDPAAALSGLASPDREAKTVLVRWVQALLAEDVAAADALLHPEFGSKPGWTPAMIHQRRDSEIARLRKLFEAADLRALAFDDVLDPRDGRTLARGEQTKPGALGGFSEESKRAVADLPEGDLLLVARTRAPVAGDAPLLLRETWVHLRKDRDAWKVFGFAGR